MLMLHTLGSFKKSKFQASELSSHLGLISGEDTPHHAP